MSAQEFGSPGEHMASMSGGGSSAARSHGPNDFIDNHHSNVIWSPGAFENLNRGYSLHQDEDFGSSARERAERDVDYFNRYYMNYNNDLFNSAKEYDMYMSNTAIQRQVEDLKKAGLNPILAARLGGAVYKGVNAPYLSISPASALNSYLDYDATMYATDVNASTQIETTRLQNNSREFIAQYDKVMDLYMQGQLFNHENELVELKKNADRYLDAMRALDNENLQKLGFKNKKELDSYNFSLQRSFYELQMSKENFADWTVKLGNFITGLSPFATLSQTTLPSFSSNPVGFIS